MDQVDHLAEFRKEWADFLAQKGHTVSGARGHPTVLQSRDRRGKKYRWVLFASAARSKSLNPSERRFVETHLNVGRLRRQALYVAIRFSDEIGKVLALPAEKVLGRKRILARKGGIPWER